MKKLILSPLFLSLFLLTAFFNENVYAQAPQAFKYQTILRNASGEILANQAVSLRLSILQGSETGTAVYTETWDKTTNAFGLIVLNVGEGTSNDDFSSIAWGADVYYLKAEVDQTGGTNYTDAGTSQLLSVPYALYAGSSANSAESPWQQNGSSIYYNAGNVGIGTSSPNKKLVIKATSNNDTLMEILDKDGNPLVVITPQLTKFNIIKENASAAGASGGFAVGRYALAKDGKATEDNNLLLVTPDSTRVYTIQETAGAQGTSGGFAVGRYALAKGDTTYNFFTNQDSTKVIIPVSDTHVGGFTVQGNVLGKGMKENKFDVSTGSTAEIIDGQNRVLWYPQKNAFLAGRLYVPHSDSVGENSLAIGYECQAKGDYSTAIGYKAVAKDTSSFAFGENAQALNVESYAFGRETIALGKRSFAFGSAATEVNSQSGTWGATEAPKALGDYSYAFGNGSVAEGFGAFAIGFRDTATTQFSTALGFGTLASGEYGSTAMGHSTKATGNGATSMGEYTTAGGWYSTAMGYGTIAEGDYSTSMGEHTKASGEHSVAMGGYITAQGDYSFGIGLETQDYWGDIPIITQDNTMAIMGGKVGIGTVNPSNRLQVEADKSGGYAARFFNDGNDNDRWGIGIQAGTDDNSGDNDLIDFYDGNGTYIGSISSTNGTVTYESKSAKSGKNNKLYTAKATDILNNLKVLEFYPSANSKHRILGFEGEALMKVLPQSTHLSKKNGEYYSDKSALVPVLVKAVQEQNKKIEKLEQEIENLKKLIQK